MGTWSNYSVSFVFKTKYHEIFKPKQSFAQRKALFFPRLDQMSCLRLLTTGLKHIALQMNILRLDAASTLIKRRNYMAV